MSQNYEVYWLKKGTILNGKYKICDVISEGGFGIVYLGVDMILKMEVAIKEYFPRNLVFRKEGENVIHVYQKEGSEELFAEEIQKFLNEARLLAQFHKLESIVTVRDFFRENNTAYIVNEHITGKSVKEHVLKDGKMDPEEVLTMMCPILNSLSVIHSQGFLHRDIAPDNIIIQDGKAVLIDFGAARLNKGEEEYSRTVFFKRGYSAEEQYIRRGKQGPATDIYAICATMYFMITGIQPEESVQRHIKDTVIPLDKQKDIPMSLAKKKAIMKGMSVAVEDRFESVDKFLRILYRQEKERHLRQYLWKGIVAVLLLLAGLGYLQLRAGDDVQSVESQSPKSLETRNVVQETKVPEPEKTPEIVKEKKKEKQSDPVVPDVKKVKKEQEEKQLRKVSKGSKVKKKKPEATPRATPTQKKAEKKVQKKVQFAGDLPW